MSLLNSSKHVFPDGTFSYAPKSYTDVWLKISYILKLLILFILFTYIDLCIYLCTLSGV